ncbi:hypothetical protein K4H40_05265 [Clostridium chauvoei]|nr:hypothetical protein [Clostridium chauvoei]ATD56153.1 hypothetical protein BTM20_00475 [Clostridium chauvoei]ATD58736.1 hypothetical protein BTM21_11845 [Clostridium chauvoei]MBX7280418.1 hypothetical protein [Clostridium chauvoei]MBX7282903.1 hypothetical protein [Clostridium chauvoei]MBX7285309.1 hypothetical protein [Clostridium chauvoei]
MLYLSDEEIKKMAINLAYGIGLGVFIGIFIDNVLLGFSLGGVISILVSLSVCFIRKILTYNLKKKEVN